MTAVVRLEAVAVSVVVKLGIGIPNAYAEPELEPRSSLQRAPTTTRAASELTATEMPKESPTTLSSAVNLNS